MASGVAFLARIKVDTNIDNLRDVLERINHDENPSVTIKWAQRDHTHFARFAILPDFDRGKGHHKLLFTAIFDGSKEDFIQDVKNHTSDLDAIFGGCEGYTGKKDFGKFFNKNNNETNTLLAGYQNTVKEIRKFLALREELVKKFDVPLSERERVINELPKIPPLIYYPKQIWSAIVRFFRTLWGWVMLLGRAIRIVFRFGPIDTWKAFRYAQEEFELDRDYTRAPVNNYYRVYPFKPGDEVVKEWEFASMDAFREEKQVMNQMNIVSINDPDPKIIKRQQIIMAIINAGGTAPNFTIPVITIHFGRWMMIDDNKRMLFLSNYDGSWENYIGEFVGQISGGLRSFWGGSLAWSHAASKDLQLFMAAIRGHQYKSSYYYCAYPKATVTSILRARTVYEGYHNNLNAKTAEKWLAYL